MPPKVSPMGFAPPCVRWWIHYVRERGRGVTGGTARGRLEGDADLRDTGLRRDMPAKKTSGKGKPTSPAEIAPGVFVGGCKDAVRFQGTRFCVLDEAPEDMPPATHIRIYDEGTDRADPKSLDRLAEAMGKAHAKGEPVLVFCGHGVRRSPLGALWYLRRSEGLSLGDAYERVRSVRPRIEHPREWLGNASELERA